MGLGLLVFYPHLMLRSCEACQEYLWKDNPQLDHVSAEMYRDPVTDIPFKRPPGVPTPCHKCPKKSPEQGKAMEKTLPLATAILDRYHRVKAVGAEAGDQVPIVRKALGICEEVVQSANHVKLSKLLQQAVIFGRR